jgi:hypothetical protein
MSDALLTAARELAEHASPEVRGVALLRIARVETASDRAEARRTFNPGLDAILGISGIEGEFLLEQAGLLAAAVTPELLGEVPSRFPKPSFGDMAV